MQRLSRLRVGAAAALVTVGLSGFAALAPGVADPSAAATVRHGIQHHVALRAESTLGTGDPATNIDPSPDYWPTCLQNGPSSQTCIDSVVAAIDHARSLEGVRPLVLPTGFAAMTPAVQTFVLSNLERVDRGLVPAVGMVDTLNLVSVDAAVRDADPVLSGWTVGPFNANSWGSIWAGDLNALAADYDWMYNDGWGPSGSYNIDCTSSGAAGCWGHRHNILSSYGGGELITGVGSVDQSQWTSIAQIFVAGSGTLPPFTTAWAAIVGTAPTSTTTTTATATTTVPTATSTPDDTLVTISAPAAVNAGAVAHLTGSLIDATTGTVIRAAALQVCRRPAGSSTTTCAPTSSDELGDLGVDARPSVTTSYWFRFAGDTVHAAARSRTVVVQARPRVHLRTVRTTTGWRVVALLTPAHAQPVRLQRHGAAGWVTVRKAVAHPRMVWSRLQRGTYRVVVVATKTTATAVAHAATR